MDSYKRFRYTHRREELREILCQYISDTLSHIDTVREFCNGHSKWTLQRETELQMMRDIKERADKIDLKFNYVRNSKDKAKAFGKYVWNALTQMTADSKRKELEKELGAVLKDTLGGMERFDYFLDAVEKLAVTSLFVFAEGSRFFHLPQGTGPASVREVITSARRACSLLIHFKRDAGAFFLPCLLNVEVLAIQLDKYIRHSQQLCDRMEKTLRMIPVPQSDSKLGKIFFWRKKSDKPEVHINADVSEESRQNMGDLLNQLNDIRMDQHFRLAFMFQEASLHFIVLFNECQPRMLKFLTELEENAVQLDSIKKGAKISRVAGSSVGVIGGILSIVGIALAPVTVAASLALTLTGMGLGVTSGVNSLVTTVTETAVNSNHQKKAYKVFQSFMKDVQRLQECLEEVASKPVPIVGGSEGHIKLGAGKVIAKAGVIGKGIDSIVDCASAFKALKSEEMIASAAGKLALQEGKVVRNVPSLAADIPDIGQLAKGTPLALSKSARAGFITLNALFIGLDIFFICKDSISLAKGSKSEVSQLIRARAMLWQSELDSWKKIHDSLCQGIWRFGKSQRILETPFYPAKKKLKVKKLFCMA